MVDASPSKRGSFDQWRAWVSDVGLQPVVIVAGSRGKTLLCKMLEAILTEAGISNALWTSSGVDINGSRQDGELGPWQDVEEQMDTGEIGIAIREVDWATASSLATAPRVPVLAVTNVCSNREDCIESGQASMANSALPALLTAVVSQGWLILNGEDLAVSADLASTPHNRLLVGFGLDSPTIERHVNTGGNIAWVANDHLYLDMEDEIRDLGSRFDLQFALEGRANFLIFGALMAGSVASTLGIPSTTITSALQHFFSDPDSVPGSFNVLWTNNSTLIIDRPSSSWFLRPVVRALRDYRRARILTVFSGLEGTQRQDTEEIGRLLGRMSNILVISNDAVTDGDRIELAIQGARRNEVPPLVIPVASEMDAVRRAIGLARPKDLIYVVSDDPKALWSELKALGPLLQIRRPTLETRVA